MSAFIFFQIAGKIIQDAARLPQSPDKRDLAHFYVNFLPLPDPEEYVATYTRVCLRVCLSVCLSDSFAAVRECV